MSSGLDPVLIREIRLVRDELTELEIEAGILPSPGSPIDAQRLRQSIAALRGIMRNALVGFAIGDPRGTIIDANEAFASMLGYTRQTLLDARIAWKQLTPPEFTEADRVARETMERTRLPHTYHKEYWRRDGSRVPVAVCVIHTTDPRDDYAVFVLDDAERQGAEAERRRAERTHQHVLDAIPDLVRLMDSEGRTVWANRSFLAFHGVGLPEITGRVAPDSWPPSLLEATQRDCETSAATGGTVDRSLQEHIRADGEKRILHTVMAPLLDSDGGVVRAVAISRDVTQRTQIEAALQRSEANLRTAETLTHTGSYECTVPCHGDDYWSDALYDILGLPVVKPPPPLLEVIDAFVHPEDRVRVRAEVLGTLSASGRLDIEFRLSRPDRSLRFVRAIGDAARRHDKAGSLLVGTVLDVTAEHERRTARSALDAKLRQAQKLEAVGIVARGIARELDGILDTIGRHARAAREAARHDPHLCEDLDHVLLAAARATSLVERLEIFSSVWRPGGQRLSLAQSIGEGLSLLRPVLPDGVEVRATLEPATPDIRGDAIQILQLLLNLFTNALHAMETTGGTLTVTLEPFDVDAAAARSDPRLRPGRYARIVVSDTGPGIAPENLERVFDPFFTTKAPGKGTGLGLSVVHGVVQEHGGRLDITSSPGEGTAIRIDLPAFEAPIGEGLVAT